VDSMVAESKAERLNVFSNKVFSKQADLYLKIKRIRIPKYAHFILNKPFNIPFTKN
jgi:hypothetical protein